MPAWLYCTCTYELMFRAILALSVQHATIDNWLFLKLWNADGFNTYVPICCSKISKCIMDSQNRFNHDNGKDRPISKWMVVAWIQVLERWPAFPWKCIYGCTHWPWNCRRCEWQHCHICSWSWQPRGRGGRGDRRWSCEASPSHAASTYCWTRLQAGISNTLQSPEILEQTLTWMLTQNKKDEPKTSTCLQLSRIGTWTYRWAISCCRCVDRRMSGGMALCLKYRPILKEP